MPATPAKRPYSRATVFLTVASLVSLTVLLVGIAWPGARVPQVAWRVGDEQRPARPFEAVASGTPIGLQLDLPFPAHVFVVSWSPLQGTIALFPSERLSSELQNPLPAGRHWLPGSFDGKPMTWPVHAVIGPIHYLTVVSREPVAALRETLARVRQMGHMGKLGAIFQDRTMYVFAPDAGMLVVPPNDRPAAAEFDAARTAFADSPSPPSEGPMRELVGHPGVFGRPFVVQGQ